MSILKEIITLKTNEIAAQKEVVPVKLLEKSIYFDTDVVSMKKYLTRTDKVGIIAEIKRKSPSRGVINSQIEIEQLSIGYMQAGASALSVLSDYTYFGGSLADVEISRQFNYCPILRKDFIVDEYQLLESKSIGADCVLLIAAALTEKACKKLARLAKSIGLEVLLEVTTKAQIEQYISTDIDLVGINNRNLHDFSMVLDRSMDLAQYIPNDFVKVSESGITQAQDIVKLKSNGFEGFLIGTHFMRHAHPELACAQLVSEVLNLRGK